MKKDERDWIDNWSRLIVVIKLRNIKNMKTYTSLLVVH